MRLTLLGIGALTVAFLATPAVAQDDDILAPLTPKKAKPAAPKKATPSKKKDIAPQATETPPPPAVKTELWVKLARPVRGAAWWLDDREIGPLPSGSIEVSPGEHLIAIRAPGHVDWSKKVTAVSGKVTEVGATLEATSGVMSVSADVAGAEVYVDGKFAGAAPLLSQPVAPGMHEISIRKEGHGSDVHSVNVRPGKEYTLIGRLAGKVDAPKRVNIAPVAKAAPADPIPSSTTQVESAGPIYSRWYFWTGIGVVVAAGAAVGGYMLYQSSQPQRPSEVCRGGECGGTLNSPYGVVSF